MNFNEKFNWISFKKSYLIVIELLILKILKNYSTN